MSECKHDFIQREGAATVDGMCPLCIAATAASYREALETIAAGRHDAEPCPKCIAREALAEKED